MTKDFIIQRIVESGTNQYTIIVQLKKMYKFRKTEDMKSLLWILLFYIEKYDVYIIEETPFKLEINLEEKKIDKQATA